MRRTLLGLFCCAAAAAPPAVESVRAPGLRQPVEILRDRWGVPHIYAKSTHDVFFAQGWMAAQDRLFQIDLWRRTGTGKLAEVLGPRALPRDRFARLVRYRGDWSAEWRAYAPEARDIATAFTAGINAYIKSLKQRPAEFVRAGYDPGEWAPEDITARMAVLPVLRNLQREIERAIRIRRHGLEREKRLFPPEPEVPLEIPRGLDLNDITDELLASFRAILTGTGADGDGEWAGSNNWVVHGSRTATGKPVLANDPHRALLIPSLRKSVHLVAPGWNVTGAGEPALPGIALGHNEQIGFGFTIVGIDQMDLYVETLNPQNPDEYQDRGQWRRMEVVKDKITVKGQGAVEVEYRYTHHGPVIHLDRRRNRAYALKWVGGEPGGAGYLSALTLARAKNWNEFLRAAGQYKTPSENLVYADRNGNIGWVASGAAPVRRGFTGLLPVPGAAGEFEWTGYLPVKDHPQQYNPAQGWIATANHNIVPKGYRHSIGHEFAAAFRHQRVAEVLGGQNRHTLEQSRELQLDVVSATARRFQGVLRRTLSTLPNGAQGAARRLLEWDARMSTEGAEPTLFSFWTDRLLTALYGAVDRPGIAILLRDLEAHPQAAKLLEEAFRQLPGPAQNEPWGRQHTLTFRHPLNVAEWSRGPLPRPGDANTVNAAGGTNLRQTNGASYRHILDLSDWDKSMVTNTPGESGDPGSRWYSSLLEDWAAGRYHPMPYTRAAVEAAAAERVMLVP